MNKKEFSRLADGQVVLLDGAMGSNMTKLGMPRNTCAEVWILEHQELAAGCRSSTWKPAAGFCMRPHFPPIG